MTPVPCKACGEPMVWLHTPSGRAMPVNADSVDDSEATEFDAAAGHESHFATCPAAKLFRRVNPEVSEPERTEEEWSKGERTT